MDDLFNFGSNDNILGTTTTTLTTTTTSSSSSSSSLPSTKTPSFNGLVQSELKNEEQTTKKPHAYKIALIGDAQVGKSTFLTRHLNGSFDTQYRATIGASTFNLQFNTNLDSHLFEVYDIAGQSLFAGKRDEYYRDIEGVIIMYDVMNWSSYDNVTDIWLREVADNAPKQIPIVIVGNKMENRETRKVSVEVVAEAISTQLDPQKIGYCEVSVKTNQNLAEPFLFLTKRLLNIHDSKALYFVSKISELNLIESMLQHKKEKDTALLVAAQSKKGQPTTDSLDDLFLSENGDASVDKKGNESNERKGNRESYLDEVLFGVMDEENKENITREKEKKYEMENSDSNKNDYILEMMSERARPNVKVSKTPKMKPVSKMKSPKSVSVNSNSKTKVQQTAATVTSSENGVVIDLLLGLQDTLNKIKSDVRRLQNDVNYLKQHVKK